MWPQGGALNYWSNPHPPPTGQGGVGDTIDRRIIHPFTDSTHLPSIHFDIIFTFTAR